MRNFQRLMPVALVMVLLSSVSCSAGGGKASKGTHEMGELVQIGAIVYNVLEVDWLTELGGEQPKVPQGRFASIRLSMTNAGNREISMPLLQLEDGKGNSFMELAEVQGVPEWLGVLRNLGPTETVTGRIVFDVKPQAYQLRLTDGGKPDEERVSLVNIPLRIQEKQPLAVEGRQ